MRSGEGSIIGLLVIAPIMLALALVAGLFYVGAVVLESAVPKPVK